MIKIAVCDDDKKFTELFSKKISASFLSYNVESQVSTFNSGIELLDSLIQRKQYYTVVFLDVEMPELGGFQTAEKLRKIDPTTILLFTTYIEHQSRNGYLYGAFRYLFKNNLEQELNEAVFSILQKLEITKQKSHHITLKHKTTGILEDLILPPSEILFLKTENNRRITMKTLYKDYDLLVKPLTYYAQLLDSKVFVQIMRSYLVNFDHVEYIEGEYFVLSRNIRIPLGVKKSSQKVSLEKYMTYLRERI